ncbi:MAG: hypothetical protein OEV40_22225 [Acidimicrobiia bacterium]|nr:hypothetical protein [Acidimicrobiia bacterium]
MGKLLFNTSTPANLLRSFVGNVVRRDRSMATQRDHQAVTMHRRRPDPPAASKRISNPAVR